MVSLLGEVDYFQMMRPLLKFILLGIFMAVGLVLQLIYNRFRRPGMADHVGNMRIPGAGIFLTFLVIAIVIFFIQAIFFAPLQKTMP